MFNLSMRLWCVSCAKNSPIIFTYTWCYITYIMWVYVLFSYVFFKISLIYSKKWDFLDAYKQPKFQHCHSMRKHKHSGHITLQGLATVKVKELVREGVFSAMAKVASLILGLVTVSRVRDKKCYLKLRVWLRYTIHTSMLMPGKVPAYST